jgi:predicted nucleic acid-binding protein
VILVDSNVPMYLVGAEHPNKSAAIRLLEGALRTRQKLVTDAEVLQEILHRYLGLRRPTAIQPCFDALLAVVDEVLPIRGEDVRRAKDIALGNPELSARDAVHAAVMEAHAISIVMSFDRGFDQLPGVTRYEG